MRKGSLLLLLLIHRGPGRLGRLPGLRSLLRALLPGLWVRVVFHSSMAAALYRMFLAPTVMCGGACGLRSQRQHFNVTGDRPTRAAAASVVSSSSC